MKTATLKRLDRLDRLANLKEQPPIQLIDVTTFSDADREAYWAGTYPLPDTPDGVPAGVVHTIVISVNPDVRDLWRETRDLDDAALEAVERRRDDEDRRERAAEREREHFERVKAAADLARTVPELPWNAYSPVRD